MTSHFMYSIILNQVSLDYDALLKLLPPTSPLLSDIRVALHRTKPRREAAQKAEMGEMMDKLKGLGNSLLGLALLLPVLWRNVYACS